MTDSPLEIRNQKEVELSRNSGNMKLAELEIMLKDRRCRLEAVKSLTNGSSEEVINGQAPETAEPEKKTLTNVFNNIQNDIPGNRSLVSNTDLLSSSFIFKDGAPLEAYMRNKSKNWDQCFTVNNFWFQNGGVNPIRTVLQVPS